MRAAPPPGGARPELAILIGLPGSGKTSFARARLAGHVHVSKDQMPQASRRDERQLALVRDALAAGRSVVVDNVNPRIADRAALIGAARALGAAVVGYALDADVKECLRRNRARQARPASRTWPSSSTASACSRRRRRKASTPSTASALQTAGSRSVPTLFDGFTALIASASSRFTSAPLR